MSTRVLTFCFSLINAQNREITEVSPHGISCQVKLYLVDISNNFKEKDVLTYSNF